MSIPGFNAESSLGANAGVYTGKTISGLSPAQSARGLVIPAAPREQWCETKYWGGVTHYFPVTVCEPIFPDLRTSEATMAAAAPNSPWAPFTPRAATSFSPLRRFGNFRQRCRVIELPLYGTVTTTQNCEDSLPDSSVLEVQEHPELKTQWTGGLENIPPPYNPGWFKSTSTTCKCCGGFQQCPNGTCVPINKSCTKKPGQA
jgi:hypothetical protein